MGRFNRIAERISFWLIAASFAISAVGFLVRRDQMSLILAIVFGLYTCMSVLVWAFQKPH